MPKMQCFYCLLTGYYIGTKIEELSFSERRAFQFLTGIKKKKTTQWFVKTLLRSHSLQSYSQKHVRILWISDMTAEHFLSVLQFWRLFWFAFLYNSLQISIYRSATYKVKNCLFPCVSLTQLFQSTHTILSEHSTALEIATLKFFPLK